MNPRSNSDPKRKRYLFKITIVGPDDKLLEEVLSTINQDVVAVDGIRITSTELETDYTDVKAVTMSPKRSALDVLLTMTYKGASAVLIVMKEPNIDLERVYRNEIRENLGSGIPTRVFIVESEFDDFKKKELLSVFGDMVEEILSEKE